MSGKTLADLRTAMANNDTYISVATSAHPDGELAGLIKAKASNATSGSSSTLGSTDQTDANTTSITEAGNASTLTNNKENTVSSSEGARITIVEGASLPDMRSFEPASITVSPEQPLRGLIMILHFILLYQGLQKEGFPVRYLIQAIYALVRPLNINLTQQEHLIITVHFIRL